jgi:hypothetical protein
MRRPYSRLSISGTVTGIKNTAARFVFGTWRHSSGRPRCNVRGCGAMPVAFDIFVGFELLAYRIGLNAQGFENSSRSMGSLGRPKRSIQNSKNSLNGVRFWCDERYGGESGIRTHGRVSPTHAFQACSFNHSDISPFKWNQQFTGGWRTLQKQTVT